LYATTNIKLDIVALAPVHRFSFKIDQKYLTRNGVSGSPQKDTASLGIAAPLASVMEDTIPFLTPMLCKMKLRLQALKGNVALFSHGQFGRALAARWIGLSLTEGRHFALGAASLSILGHEASHPKTPVIVLWNAVPALLSATPETTQR
jgi:hypothetical protein